MGFRFRRSIKIAPGFRVNLGKRGVSISAGVRGATITAGKRGVYGNVGIPGTGLSYRSKISGKQSLLERKIQSSEIQSFSTILSLLEDGNVIIKDKNGVNLPKKYIKIAREQKQQVFDAWLKNECDELNTSITKILNIHLDTPNPNGKTTYISKIFDTQKPTLIYRKIGFFDKIFKSRLKKLERENIEIKKKYEEECQGVGRR